MPREKGPPSEIGLRIRAIRLSKGITQSELGKLTTMGRSWPGLVESGHIKKPSASAVAEAAKVLGVDPSLLLYGEKKAKKRSARRATA